MRANTIAQNKCFVKERENFVNLLVMRFAHGIKFLGEWLRLKRRGAKLTPR